MNVPFVLIKTDLKAKNHLADVTLVLLGLLKPLLIVLAQSPHVHETRVAVFARETKILVLSPNVKPQRLRTLALVAALIAIVPLALVLHCNVFLKGGIARCREHTLITMELFLWGQRQRVWISVPSANIMVGLYVLPQSALGRG